MNYYDQAYNSVVEFTREQKEGYEQQNIYLKKNLENEERSQSMHDDDRKFLKWNNDRIMALNKILSLIEK